MRVLGSVFGALLLTLGLGLSSGCFLVDSGHRCELTQVEYPMDQTPPGGFSGNALAKDVVGNYQVLLRPSPTVPTDRHVTVTALEDNTPAKLSIELLANPVMTHEISEYIPCKPGGSCPDNVVTCEDNFMIPVRVRLLSSNGEMDESWEGEFRGLVESETPSEIDWDFPSLSLERPPESFVGAFRVSEPSVKPDQRITSHAIKLRVVIRDHKLVAAQLSSELAAVGSSRKDGSRYRYFQNLVDIVPASSDSG